MNPHINGHGLATASMSRRRRERGHNLRTKSSRCGACQIASRNLMRTEFVHSYFQNLDIKMEPSSSLCTARYSAEISRTFLFQNLQVDFSIKSSIRRRERTTPNRQSLHSFHTMHFPTAFTLALPAIALATVIPHDGGNCNTGPVQCCNQVQEVRGLPTKWES